MKAFSQALSSPRALPALCCQNLGDVPRPGAEHVPANWEKNKPLADSQEAPSQPPPPRPPAPAPFPPYTIQDLPSSVLLNHSPGKPPQSLQPATRQHVWGQIRRLRGRLGWGRAGSKVPAFAISHSKCSGCFPGPSPLSTFTALPSCWHRWGMDLGGELKKSQGCFKASFWRGDQWSPPGKGGSGCRVGSRPDLEKFFRWHR